MFSKCQPLKEVFTFIIINMKFACLYTYILITYISGSCNRCKQAFMWSRNRFCLDLPSKFRQIEIWSSNWNRSDSSLLSSSLWLLKLRRKIIFVQAIFQTRRIFTTLRIDKLGNLWIGSSKNGIKRTYWWHQWWKSCWHESSCRSIRSSRPSKGKTRRNWTSCQENPWFRKVPICSRSAWTEDQVSLLRRYGVYARKCGNVSIKEIRRKNFVNS